MDRRRFLRNSGIALGSILVGGIGGYAITECSKSKFKDDGNRLCGTNLVTWRREGFHQIDKVLERLIGLTNHISLVTSYSMKTIYSKRIIEDGNTPTLGSLEFAIDKIKSMGGIKVMLKPHINVMKGARALIYPSQEFYKMYFEDFIYPMAEFAQSNEVSQFCIGTELMLAATISPSAFEKGIKGVRKRFNGELTFAAFDSTAALIDFWGELDFIGYNHYKPVQPNPSVLNSIHHNRRIKNPSVLDIENDFNPAVSQLESLAKKYSKKVLFTEYGCTSLDGCSYMPTTDERRKMSKKNLDFEEQDNYLEGFYNSFWEQPWCLGGDLWCIYNPEEVSRETRAADYYWLDKPVEAAITERYATSAKKGLRF